MVQSICRRTDTHASGFLMTEKLTLLALLHAVMHKF
jgi:hypothetical protein